MNPVTGTSEPSERPARYPAVARACVHLNILFGGFWIVYLVGPDALGLAGWNRESASYALFSAGFFLLHFLLISTAIIALFVVIIEIHAERPVRGFRGVLVALALPIVSFLYFSVRFLAQVDRWLQR